MSSESFRGPVAAAVACVGFGGVNQRGRCLVLLHPLVPKKQDGDDRNAQLEASKPSSTTQRDCESLLSLWNQDCWAWRLSALVITPSSSRSRSRNTDRALFRSLADNRRTIEF
ncbi:hypothetical protein EYF80_010889 [Liparis tanakae]|uniref:Uncharacterized protein n=1 Tax=Liparis tanakae TaxID=230148 RepID=A0A4Z2IP71_9TELE|nr:hypothetical protein EYF80_010889 [Liparis tanakae]